MTASSVAIPAGTAFIMFYSGLLFEPALMRRQLTVEKMRALLQCSFANYLIVPLVTLALIWLLPPPPGLALVLLTLSVMPCAPVVPMLVDLMGEAPEWPMLVFLAFSLVGLLLIPVVVQVLPQPWAAGKYAELNADSTHRLLLFALLGYLPLSLGVAFRVLAPAQGMVARKKLRPATPIFSVVLLATVFIDHAQEILGLGLRDMALMALFVLVWAVIGLALGRHSRRMPMTNALISGFRNITMALAFSNIVFFHTNATSYVFAVTVVVLLLTQLAFTGRKLLGKRKAVGA